MYKNVKKFLKDNNAEWSFEFRHYIIGINGIAIAIDQKLLDGNSGYTIDGDYYETKPIHLKELKEMLDI